MDFKVVPDTLRDSVKPARRVRSDFVQALLDGKTLTIDKDDRKRIGGNTKTLRAHGLRLRSGLLDDDKTVVVWTEPVQEDTNGTDR